MFTRSRKVWNGGERQYTVITKQQVKDEQIKRKDLFFVFFKCLNSKKTSSRLFKRISRKNNINNKKISRKSYQSQ